MTSRLSTAAKLLLLLSTAKQDVGAKAMTQMTCVAPSDCVGYKGCTANDAACKCKSGKCKKKGVDCKTNGQWKWGCPAGEECSADMNDDGGTKVWGTCQPTWLKGAAHCERQVWSAVDPNPDWTTHPFHGQVWYHSLGDIYNLWKEDYFDYVLDIRPLQNTTIDYNGAPLLLEGWESFHIPGSYPITIFPADTPASEVDMLVDFTASNVCKDARIFVHCWSGISGNRVSQTLIELGFTNVHAAGPQGSAGIWDWKQAGYELVMDDTFDPDKLQPSCLKSCED